MVVKVEDLTSLGQVGGLAAQSAASAAIKRRMQKLNGNHVRALFETKKMGYGTALIMAVWALIGLAYPLSECP